MNRKSASSTLRAGGQTRGANRKALTKAVMTQSDAFASAWKKRGPAHRQPVAVAGSVPLYWHFAHCASYTHPTRRISCREYAQPSRAASVFHHITGIDMHRLPMPIHFSFDLACEFRHVRLHPGRPVVGLDTTAPIASERRHAAAFDKPFRHPTRGCDAGLPSNDAKGGRSDECLMNRPFCLVGRTRPDRHAQRALHRHARTDSTHRRDARKSSIDRPLRSIDIAIVQRPFSDRPSNPIRRQSLRLRSARRAKRAPPPRRGSPPDTVPKTICAVRRPSCRDTTSTTGIPSS